MSISKAIASRTNNKFVIPCAGKMFKSNVSETNKALCFVLNKGYVQTDTLEEIENYKNIIDKKYPSLIHVGKVDKIILNKDNKLVYRQRYFFKNFQILLEVCNFFGFTVEISEKFEITINNVMNCQSELKYLEIYARKQEETITEYLTNACLIYLNDFLKLLDVSYKLPKDIEKFLEGKRSYLERAPFLIVSYSIDKKESGIFISEGNFKDTRKFDITLEHTVDTVDTVNYGYTDENVRKDLKAGYFVL